MFEHSLLIGLATIAVFSVSLVFYLIRKLRENVNTQSSSDLQKIADRDRQIKKLSVRINELSELNSRYLSFIFNIPFIMQRLNTTLKLQEIAQSLIEMVNNIVLTEKVELFLFDETTNQLRRLHTNAEAQEKQVIYALGEGLIGSAAKNRFMMNEHYPEKYTNGHSNSQFWMAVPIIYKDKLLGVLGVGEINNPIGNESELLKMIADIAGVALFNHAILDDAQHRANTDPLTGLHNRNYFFQMSQYHLEKAVREGTSISIILFDIDNFKHYNDTNGHNAGDKLLVELSRLIRDYSRKEAVIARYGGEEFIIMLPGVSKEDAFIYADRLRKKITLHYFLYKEKQPLGFVSISGGVAGFPVDGDSINKVIQHADIALYQAKSEGRNRILLYYKSQDLENSCISQIS